MAFSVEFPVQSFTLFSRALAPGFYRHLGWHDCGLMEDGQLKFCKALHKVHNERK